MENYQAWVQDDIAPFSNLKYKSIEYPTINENELILETKAATLNFADLLLSSGMYQSNPKTPFVPGFEVSGIVKECSTKSKFAVGDRVVAATTVFRSGRHGSFGEYCVASENLTYKLPEEKGPVEVGVEYKGFPMSLYKQIMLPVAWSRYAFKND